MTALTPSALAELLKPEKRPRLIDVRERDEWEICRLPNAELIPLSEFASRVLDEIGKEEDIILYCHHGVRSERAGVFLLKSGYQQVRHLQGGIDAWSVEVDTGVKRY
ncbi:MAG: rhodanese-like domain-containing protein [Methylacidiphilales bacterium]|nr:rhodanese-like domain-containing protein [Candidatus Methylacidiphilales bacterium]